MKIKLSTHVWFQIANLAALAFGQLADTVPERARPYVALGQLVASGIAGIIAHNSNPDGTPASQEYKKPQ
jgi:hypothetical protein